MKKKNIVLLAIVLLSFIFLIIATFAFGFKPQGGTKGDLSDLENATGFGKDSYGLMVSGLVLIGLTVLLTAIFVYLGSAKAKGDAAVLKWMQISIYGLFVLSVILVLAGEALFISKTYDLVKEFSPDVKFGDVWDTGIVAGMFIFTLLPLPLVTIPCFIKN